MIRVIMMMLLLYGEKWQTKFGYFRMHANIFAIKCILHGLSSTVIDAICHYHIATIVSIAAVAMAAATASVRTASDSTAWNLWQLNEIGKSENCIIIKSNQHEIKCLKWKFYRESQAFHRVYGRNGVWVRVVDRKNNIIYSVRFATIDWLIWYSCSKQAMMLVFSSQRLCAR